MRGMAARTVKRRLRLQRKQQGRMVTLKTLGLTYRFPSLNRAMAPRSANSALA